MRLAAALVRRIARFFVAGVLAILPVVVTVAVVIWVIDHIKYYFGPETTLGKQLTTIGLTFDHNSTMPYLVGWMLVILVVFAVGVVVDLGAKKWLGRTVERLFRQIPLVGSIYSTSRQVVDMLDQGDPESMKGMTPVFCSFGRDQPSSVLALLVSPVRYDLAGREHLIVIIPTAPVPLGGAMMFVPVECVRPAGMSIDGLMSMYLSMGATAGEFLQPQRSVVPDTRAR